MRWSEKQIAAVRTSAPIELGVQLAVAAGALVLLRSAAPALTVALWQLAAVALSAGVGWWLTSHVSAGQVLRLLVWQRAAAGVQWGLLALHVDAGWTPLALVLVNAVPLAAAAALVHTRSGYWPACAAFIAPLLGLFAASLVSLATPVPLALALLDLACLAMFLALSYERVRIFGQHAQLRSASAELEQRLGWTTRAFRDQRSRMEREEALARQVFDRLTRQDTGATPWLQCWAQAAASFSGDLLLYSTSPSGHVNILFCDFTGHGLPAALGAIPVSGVFYTMTRKEYPPAAIAGELNRKLADLLPADYFCCAQLIRISPDRSRLAVCNAGLPPLLLVDAGGAIRERYTSRVLPLGISTSLPALEDELPVAPDDAIYLFSDGLIEAENLLGERFGLQRLERELACAVPEHGRLTRVREAVTTFIGVGEPTDDISLLELQPHAWPAAAAATESGEPVGVTG